MPRYDERYDERYDDDYNERVYAHKNRLQEEPIYELYDGLVFRPKYPDDIISSQFGCGETQFSIERTEPYNRELPNTGARYILKPLKRCRNMEPKEFGINTYILNDLYKRNRLIREHEIGYFGRSCSSSLLCGRYGGGAKSKKRHTKHAAKHTKRRRTRLHRRHRR